MSRGALKKVGRKQGPRALTVARAVYLSLHDAAEKVRGAKWPNKTYIGRPVEFVRECLGEEPLPHQIEVMRQIALGNKCSVKSGTKTGKTKMVVWLALWFYCSYPCARVFFTATTNDQIDRTIWQEMIFTVHRARARGFYLEEVGASAASGIHAPDGRSISGFTSNNPIALQGLSGSALFLISDEASSMSDIIGETIMGNTMGGAHILWVGNPNANAKGINGGPFYNSHHKDKHLFYTATFNSEKIAQSLSDRGMHVPGVANLQDVENFASLYGKGTAAYSIRVLGEYVTDDNAAIYPASMIMGAQARWGEITSPVGTLRIGVDPAGEGMGGDETAVSVVRGNKQLELLTFRGLSVDGCAVQIRGLIAKWRSGNEIPQVLIDSEVIGAKLFGKLFGIAGTLKITRPAESFDVYGIKSSHPASREPMTYDRLRDELHANLRNWLETGGIILDYKLEAELQLPRFNLTVSGKAKATPKDYIRDKLSRSPDRFDALCLSVWDPHARNSAIHVPQPTAEIRVERYEKHGGGYDDPNPWADQGDIIDPYKQM